VDFIELRLPEELIASYPNPLSVSARRVNDATESVEKYLCLAGLFEVTLKYLTALSLAQYLRDRVVDKHIQSELKKLPRPSLGVWDDILRSCTRFYARHKDSPFAVPELRDGYAARLRDGEEADSLRDWAAFLTKYLEGEEAGGSRKVSLEDVFTLAVRYRNRSWGHGIAQLTPEFCAPHGEQLFRGLTAILRAVAYLSRYPLRYVKEVRKVRGQDTHVMFDYMGPGGRQGPPYVGDYVQERRLYLCDSAGAPCLCLHPLFVVNERRLYVLEYHEVEGGEGRIGYSDCETGKGFEPTRLASYQLSQIADDRHNKLGDSALPVPPADDGLEVEEAALAPTLDSVLGRLDEDGRRALELALGESLRIGHFWLGVEFLLMALSKAGGPVIAGWMREIGLDPSEFRGMARGLVGTAADDWRDKDPEALGSAALASFKEADPTRLAEAVRQPGPHPPVVTPRLKAILSAAADLADTGPVGPLHLFLAALDHPECPPVLFLLMRARRAGQGPDEVRARLRGLDKAPPPSLPPEVKLPGPAGVPADGPPSYRPAGSILGRYGRDLTAEARAGKLSPAVGVDDLLRRMKRVLLQLRANNPLLIGEPGVGKTALVEGLAHDLVHGPAAPAGLGGKRVVELSVNDLMAGTRYRGELEERAAQLLAEVKASPDVIVFIDEVHTILAGGDEGGGRLADALKPALARGEFPCIGATTVAEYRRHVERDSALSRRFEVIEVPEPGVDACVRMVQGHAAALEKHYGARLAPGAVEAAVRLAARYLPEERLPAKAIKLLEQAGAYARVPSLDPQNPLSAADKERPVAVEINEELVRRVLAKKTGIPLEQLTGDERERMRDLGEALKRQVVGQDEAVEAVAQIIKSARGGLRNPAKPVGVFLFVGPTGVGKTELARALAGLLFGSRDALVRLDMSEYLERHQVSRLIGAPPGYVGYEDEGQLTGKLRLRPYSVVLLDEIEKAHDEVHHLFLQLFDEGRLTDGRGRTVNGREAVYIMTSNTGSEVYDREAIGYSPHEKLSPQWWQEKRAEVDQALRRRFKPEFLNRIDRVVHFRPLGPEDMPRIFEAQLVGLKQRLLDGHGARLSVTAEAVEHICRQAFDPLNGARPLKRAVARLLEEPLADLILAGKVRPGDTVVVACGVAGLQFTKALD
jgi:ATP-dependent Clp protease ATP-binding subunit ClpC